MVRVKLNTNFGKGVALMEALVAEGRARWETSAEEPHRGVRILGPVGLQAVDWRPGGSQEENADRHD